MQDIEKLTELIEQASSAINLLSPEDISEIEDLRKILDEINKSLVETCDLPTQVLEQAKGETSESMKLLQQILQQEVEDTVDSIQCVSKMVSSLQGIITQLDQTLNVSEEEQSKMDSQDTCGIESQGTAISEEDVPLILDFITESCEHIEAAEAGLLELENNPGDKDIINQIFRGFHTIKGMAGFLNLTDIGSLAHSAENLLGLARDGTLILERDSMDVIFESMDMMKKMIATLKESVEAGSPVPAQKDLKDLLDKLKASADGTPVVQKNNEEESKDCDPLQDEKIENILVTENESKTDNASAKKKGHSGEEKIKVSTTRLDNLINMVGELVISQLMVTEEVSKNIAVENQLNSKVAHQSKIVRELQELSLAMRMVPIGGVFQKMARLVRDLSRKAGKNINFVVSGEETELDRSIVDKISDPLVHMIRNSVDHGIESNEERTKSGKNPVGQIELRAFHQAGNIVIEIQDDGKGLSKERILKKAIENGIIDSGQELPDEDIYKLIFHAGLSTAQKVTSISGRGVGMDVVKKNIESLNGKIDIKSESGKGTTFTIRLPLTLAIIDGQIIKVGNERFIIPINSIVNSFRPTAKQISTIRNRNEMVMVRGELIPLIRLYKLFGISPVTDNPTESLLVIVENDTHRYSFLVDELLDQQQVVIKNLGDGLGKIKGISGGAIMGDGKVSLIIDVPGLVELSQN